MCTVARAAANRARSSEVTVAANADASALACDPAFDRASRAPAHGSSSSRCIDAALCVSAACGGTARAEGCRETTHSAKVYHINSATQRDDATQRGDSTADDDKGGAAALDSRYHAVWVDFFCECWMAGAPIETAAQLRDALQISRKHPLDKQTVVKLGVRVEGAPSVRSTASHASRFGSPRSSERCGGTASPRRPCNRPYASKSLHSTTALRLRVML